VCAPRPAPPHHDHDHDHDHDTHTPLTLWLARKNVLPTQADAFAHYRTNDADDMSVEFSSTTAVVERPEGVPDIDADNTDDPQMVTDYAKQIHTYAP